MQDYIKLLQSKALSNKDLERLTNNKAKIIIYPQLKKYKTIERLFKKYDSIILLYLTRQNFGHWVGLIRHSNKLIEFFDSYGLFPDEELKFTQDHNVKGQDLPLLTGLLLDAMNKGYNIEYNDHKLQKMMKDVSTCGRHVAIRINYKDIPLEDYVKLIKSNGKSPDYNVTSLSSYI